MLEIFQDRTNGRYFEPIAPGELGMVSIKDNELAGNDRGEGPCEDHRSVLGCVCMSGNQMRLRFVLTN